MNTTIRSGEVISFDEDKRELSMRVVPWDTDAKTARGYERFERGAFADLDPGKFVLRQRHADPPTGRGIELNEGEEWLEMTFRVARTQAGDEQLTLAKDGIETGVSVGFEDGQFEISKAEDGRKRITHQRVNPEGMLEVSTTYVPAFREAAVLQIRQSEVLPMAEATIGESGPEVIAPIVTFDRAVLDELESKFMQRIDRLEEKQAAIMLNAPHEGSAKRELTRIVKLQIRELENVITTDNAGVVPDAMVSEMLGKVESSRPFLNGTRRLATPAAGTHLLFPKITQLPEVDVQESEKGDLASRATAITSVDFPMVTVGGAADLAMQLIQRSSPQFLELWLELLGGQYAIKTDDLAVDALLAETAVVEGGELDPAAPQFGGAFTNAVTATNRLMTPDRIFLSTAAIAAFIDALEPSGGGGRPLYPGIASIAGLPGAGTLPGGFTLQPVWTPALDDESVDIIVGPSGGFVWAEDGTYTLQADVPSKFGRDVGIAGMIWYAPIYPAAFTTYTLGS